MKTLNMVLIFHVQVHPMLSHYIYFEENQSVYQTLYDLQLIHVKEK